MAIRHGKPPRARCLLTLAMLAALSVNQSMQWPKPALIRKSDLQQRPKEFFKHEKVG